MTKTITATEHPITLEVLDRIADAIHTELVKRGFHAPITLTRTFTKNGEPKLELNSEPFQTTPVLFAELRVISFSTGVFTTKEGILKAALGVYVNYEHFNGGRNAVKLFDFRCSITANNDIYDREIH